MKLNLILDNFNLPFPDLVDKERFNVIKTEREDAWVIERVEGDKVNGSEVKATCAWCGKKATRQTYKGKENQESGGLSQNNGWFCDKCWKKGEDEEKEAMYE